MDDKIQKPYMSFFEPKVLDGVVREGHMISYLNKEFEPHFFIKMIREQNLTEKEFSNDEAKNLIDKHSGDINSAMAALVKDFK